MKHALQRLLLAALLSLGLLSAGTVVAAPVSADIGLRAGWNLIAFPVAPADASPAIVLADLIAAGQLRSLWTYDAQSRTWQAFTPGMALPGVPPLNAIQTGRGYWLHVSAITTLRVTSAEIPAPLASVASLTRDWNLIASSSDEAVPYDRFFNGVPVRQIWTYDALTQQFEAIVLPPSGTGEPLRQDFTQLQPDRGYWVQLDQSQPGNVSFGPDLGTALAGDLDVMPLLPPPSGPGQSVLWNPLSAGDEDIGMDGFYDSPQTQRAVTFREAVDQQGLVIFNRGSGVLSYTASVINDDPLCGSVPAANLPWLYFRNDIPGSFDVQETQTTTGAVATSSDSLQLYANRTGLTPGLYCSVLRVATNSTSGVPDDMVRDIKAFVRVPEIIGDYELVAQIERLNDKTADTAAPRFYLSLYRDADGLKAIIDEDRTLLVPQRVRMLGDVYETATNRFQIAGSFALPPGHPSNPYTTGLRRDISFVLRRRERGDPPGGGFGPLDLVGDYAETIRGPLPEPIRLTGTVSGERRAAEPSVFDEVREQSLAVQGIADGATTTYTFTITEKRLITEVLAEININHTSPRDLWIRLEPPAALGVGSLTLRRDSDLPLGQISFEDTQVAIDDLSVLGGELSVGVWRLQIQDEVNNGETGSALSAAVIVKGTRVVNISGTVDDVGADAVVTLTGCGQTLSATTNGAGGYLFSNLVDCAYRISVQAAGFERAFADVFLDPDDPDAVVNLAPAAGGAVPDTNIMLPCERDAGQCVGLRLASVVTTAGAGGVGALSYAKDSATFDIDRPPVGTVGPEDSDLFLEVENPLTETNACVTLSNPAQQGSPCTAPGNAVVDPPVGANALKAHIAIGGPVVGRSVRDAQVLSIGANP